ncbi:MAG: butyrate kinase [Synergistetes bacterium]|nr:butyrate kinase [Synergistota bacterium]MDW8191780.1 butyrate kinase [Synergistota bacterium]
MFLRRGWRYTFKILVVNPGSTSTKIASFIDEKEAWREVIYHSKEELSQFKGFIEQRDFRKDLICKLLDRRGESLSNYDAFVGIGGLIDPVEGGTYLLTPKLLEDLKRGGPWEHVSNLGGIIAFELASEFGKPAFIVDPVSVDEFQELAYYTGLPFVRRVSLVHALNIKAVSRKASKDIGKKLEETSFVVAHLGGGFSIAAVKGGRIIDANVANDMGPYSPERSGGLPPLSLIKYASESGLSLSEIKRVLGGKGGLKAYLGTTDLRDVRERIKKGDDYAKLVYKGMVYQIAKEIGAMTAVLKGDIDAIVITGGMANDEELIKDLGEFIGWLSKVLVYKGEFEMEALAFGALRVLKGEEKARLYKEVG